MESLELSRYISVHSMQQCMKKENPQADITPCGDGADDSERKVNEKMNTVIPVIDVEATGKNIVTLRKKAGLTVKDIQNAMGFCNPQAIYKWQKGENLPTVDNLLILASMFNVRIDDILVCNECSYAA